MTSTTTGTTVGGSARDSARGRAAIKVSGAVSAALAEGRPVVALESTIFSRLGLPAPANGDALRRCVAAVRAGGAEPAVTAILDGKVHVGLEPGEEERILAGTRKVAERDIAVAVAQGLEVGVTTVSASVALAHAVGIQVFATGGIGGVHRGAELTGDISADLDALANHPVITVCAGAKAFLDLARTLEYLETVGVPVLGWQHDWFPAFYLRSSGLPVPHRVETARVAADVLRSRTREYTGVLLTVPIPASAELAPGPLNAALEAALAACAAAHITGAAVTPYVLERIERQTAGASVPANLALAENNARVAALVAAALTDTTRILRRREITMTGNYVLDLAEIDATKVALAGGKGAHLGELLRIGVRVPAGWCVTTDAFRRLVATTPLLDERLDELSRVQLDDRAAIDALSAQIRQAIEDANVPDDLAAEITRAVTALGEQTPCAVRSSATAEDLPTASFAGQQDTYLNVTGTAAIIRHVSRCWASLFSARAVVYRQRNGFDHRKVQMAVVVQEMVAAQASGVLFTADPVTSNRKVVSVEAVPGLGEALVSGLVNADVYKIRDGEIIDRERHEQPVLTGAQLLRLATLGRRIEAHFGRPQDIEWCLADDEFQVVQSRPITTLFPVPEASDDGNHVYVSVGHQQMMTDAMKPLGISMWQLTAAAPMATAGGRLFVDVTRMLGTPSSRAALVKALGTSDPLIGDALRSVIDRGDFIPELPAGDAATLPRSVAADDAIASLETDPAIVTEMIDHTQASLDALQRGIRGKHGQDLLDFIAADVQELKKVLFTPQSLRMIRAGMDASGWLNEHLQEWLGEKNAADTLTQSAPGNVTAEMGLALLDVADTIRPHPDVVSFLEHVTGPEFLDQLPALDGGRAARDAIDAFLSRYGMRGVGEIDITRPRWRERPDMLMPVLLSDVRNFGPGAGKQRFEQGRQDASNKEDELLARLRTLPDGELKAAETKQLIDRVRTFAGYREYPKYHMVSRYFVYKQALLAEADRLVTTGVLRDREDIFYLTFGELGAVLRTGKADENLIRERRHEFLAQAALTPPRVLTSDGEALTGSYRRGDIPAGALTGLPVSAGTVEGRARVILNLSEAALGPADILVTAYTDPSWTPVFVAIKGLVTEVGGLMTHGAVIAREYGLPAVVGVEHATRLIRDGQPIRVHGTDGYVELLN